MSDKKTYGFTTTILHGDRQKCIEQGSLHKPVHTSVAFGYGDARQLASVFQGKEPGFRYGRQGNPTVGALEDKITKMEDGVGTLCFATGMGAIGAKIAKLFGKEPGQQVGDHLRAFKQIIETGHLTRSDASFALIKHPARPPSEVPKEVQAELRTGSYQGAKS